MVTMQIHKAACRGCQMCVDICPTKVLDFDTQQEVAIVVREQDCIACLSCKYLCPSNAIVHDNYHRVKNFYRDKEYCERMEKFL
jgi:ferredoxin